MVRYRWNLVFKEAAFFLCKEQKIPKFERISIGVENRSCHPMDLDNLSSSAKPLIDGIVAAGVIPDDNIKHFVYLGLSSVKVSKKNLERLTITIHEIL